MMMVIVTKAIFTSFVIYKPNTWLLANTGYLEGLHSVLVENVWTFQKFLEKLE